MRRIEPGPGQESVWDYPRPPDLQPLRHRVHIEHGGQVIAESERSLRVLETSHPPVPMIPPSDVRMDWLVPNGKTTTCEFKGKAEYLDLKIPDVPVVANAAWRYPEPTARFSAMAGHIAFYASRVDACYIAGERVQAQEGDFYGGWITSAVVGPFKGAVGTLGW